MEKLMEFIHVSELYDEKFVRERFIEYEGYDFTAIPEEEIEPATEAEENAWQRQHRQNSEFHRRQCQIRLLTF